MGRLFGTDGIRGIANRDLSIRRAEEVGMALAEVIRGEHPEKRPTVVIGRDTRLSGEMLQAALAGGLMAGGADVVLLGVVPTPAVAYLTVQKKAAAGVVISASHNPYEFNGIKIFGPEGYKLTDDEEDEIERMLLDRDIPMIPVEPEEIGTCREDREAAVQYAGYLASTVPEKLTGMKVLVDCSNGAAVRTAEELFSLLGAEATILCDAPDGTNINRECGSTHVEHLASLMAEGKYDLAVAFDGDADRCLAVDEKGHVVNGDQMIAIFARQMKAEGRLPGDAAVVTVMSSFGFFRFPKNILFLVCFPIHHFQLFLHQSHHFRIPIPFCLYIFHQTIRITPYQESSPTLLTRYIPEYFSQISDIFSDRIFPIVTYKTIRFFYQPSDSLPSPVFPPLPRQVLSRFQHIGL